MNGSEFDYLQVNVSQHRSTNILFKSMMDNNYNDFLTAGNVLNTTLSEAYTGITDLS